MCSGVTGWLPLSDFFLFFEFFASLGKATVLVTVLVGCEVAQWPQRG
jgi:hypothetical protein